MSPNLIILFHPLLLLMNLTPVQPKSPPPDTIVPYKQTPERTLNLHLFQPESGGGTLHPVIVFFHGGGWAGGTPNQFYPQCDALRNLGVLCISVEYRLIRTDKTTPQDAIRDAFDAMRFIRANARSWGADPERIAAGGGSAGAHLAAATATLTAESLAGSPDAARAARPKLLLLFNPVYDNSPDGSGNETLGVHWRDASPAHNLHNDMPPTLVMLGDQDHLIPVTTAQRVAAELDRLHVPNRLILYPGAVHGFFNPDRDPPHFYHQSLADTLQFLTEHNWISSEN